MKRLTTSFAVLALCGGAFAQAGYSPLPIYETYGGSGQGSITKGGAEYYFGRYSQGRFQLADGNFRNTLPLMSKVSYRPSNTISYYSYYGTGRTWSNVTLNMSNTSITKMTGATGSTWSTNQTSTPLQVFSGSVTWPTRNGVLGDSQITNWGQHSFGFTTPWVRATASPDGLNSDILCDYQFSGGTLANNGTWTSTYTRYYYLDGYAISSFAQGPLTYYHDNTTRGCTDSRARPPFTRAYCHMYCYHYGPGYGTPTNIYNNKMRFYHYGYNLPPTSNYVVNVGLAVNASGIAYGAGCEKLYISGAPLGFPGTTNTYGSTGAVYFGLTNGLLPANPAFIGLTVITQDTWSDSTTNAAMISAASASKIPALTGLQSAVAARRFCRYFYLGTGLASYSSLYNYANPICKYN